MNLKVKKFAMIEELEIEDSDLTFFIGEQGTGKSLILQLIKLLEDKNHIRKTLEQYGFVWRTPKQNLGLYYGEGMGEIWSDNTSVNFNNREFKKDKLKPIKREPYKDATEKVFYIPAQRIMCLEDGWPKYFTSYSTSTPYVMRHFSEILRQVLEEILSSKLEIQLFPMPNRLNQFTRAPISNNIYNQNILKIESQSGKKNVRMLVNNNISIPFMTWSAGQKEFFPLLVSLYWLCPPSRIPQRDDISTVILEEPEMGLHPSAIHSVFIQILELLNRGYKIYVSTHSTNFLEYLWVIKEIQNSKDNKKRKNAFESLIGLALNSRLQQTLNKVKIKIYHFHKDKGKVHVQDISALNVEAEDKNEWGGLLLLSKKAAKHKILPKEKLKLT